jgi:hypothetical protein
MIPTNHLNIAELTPIMISYIESLLELIQKRKLSHTAIPHAEKLRTGGRCELGVGQECKFGGRVHGRRDEVLQGSELERWTRGQTTLPLRDLRGVHERATTAFPTDFHAKKFVASRFHMLNSGTESFWVPLLLVNSPLPHPKSHAS